MSTTDRDPAEPVMNPTANVTPSENDDVDSQHVRSLLLSSPSSDAASEAPPNLTVWEHAISNLMKLSITHPDG